MPNLLPPLLVVLLTTAATVAERIVFDFESLPSGERYGGYEGDSPGDLAFSQNGVDVWLREFSVRGSTLFNVAEVGGFTANYFSSTPLTISNINLEFDFSSLDFTIDRVTLDYADFGGVENLGVNGELLQLNYLALAPATIGGASVVVTVGPPSGSRGGTVTIEGAIERLTIGGQEFGIDNLVATGVGPLQGDYNSDGTVDTRDYDLWKVTYGLTSLLAADGNHDGVVNAADYAVWRDAYSAATEPTPTPEPTTLALVAAALVACRYSSSCRRPAGAE